MLRLKNIVKHYGTKDNVVHALKGVSLDFRKSEFVSILGPSGCGKTTLLNIVGGLDKYTSGDLVINGVSTKQYKDKDWDTYRNHTIGFVFQSYNLIPHLNVLGNVEIALSLTGVKKNERRARALAALEKVGLKDQAKKHPNQLSGGQMQRVAIARALVNDPQIILADEPTGALDSETSVQVMDILKEISADRLVIMVTHNNDLANKYSTRIISMLDGEITKDTNPYVVTQEDEFVTETIAQKDTKSKESKKIKKYSSMGILTSFNLSLRNLLSKKGRTTMTSFAGSIGIIGVALVLAISNGFTKYIDNMQSDTLGNYPVTVSAIAMDTSKLTSVELKPEAGSDSDSYVKPYTPNSQAMDFGKYNMLTNDFLNYVSEFEQSEKDKGEESNIYSVEYNYFTPLKLVYKNTAGNYGFYKKQNVTSVMSGTANATFYPLINNKDFILSQYDVIYGEFPEVNPELGFTNEVLLVVDQGNKISDSVLKELGFVIEENVETGEYDLISIEDICKAEFKVVYNDDYYVPNSANFDEITEFAKVNTQDQSVLENLYNNATTTLKISGVLRLKEDATTNVLTSGIAYLNDFKEHYRQSCEDSLIAQKQATNMTTFYDRYHLTIAEMVLLPELGNKIAQGFGSVEEINNFLFAAYKYRLDDMDARELGLQQIGVSDIPINITFYPKNFEGKNAITSMIDDYNAKQTNENLKLVYTDSAEFLTSSLGQLIDIISYVLIAFAGISLVVSSVMIGVITYASVVERTKEIGVLRSLGARKKDISRVFNAETILIGFSAGALGILVSYLICPIINLIIRIVAGGAIGSIAILNPLHALILVVISMTLTFISGLIPSKVASKKDPVVALRVE